MNFYDKKVRKLVAAVIIILVVAMVATSILPYLI